MSSGRTDSSDVLVGVVVGIVPGKRANLPSSYWNEPFRFEDLPSTKGRLAWASSPSMGMKNATDAHSLILNRLRSVFRRSSPFVGSWCGRANLGLARP
jgi:hypothetical protein